MQFKEWSKKFKDQIVDKNKKGNHDATIPEMMFTAWLLSYLEHPHIAPGFNIHITIAIHQDTPVKDTRS